MESSQDAILSKTKNNIKEQNSVYSIPSKSTCICVLKEIEKKKEVRMRCAGERKKHTSLHSMSRGMPKKQSIYCLQERKLSRETGRGRNFTEYTFVVF